MDTASDVLILARTKMNGGRVCVGGYDLHERKYVRLLTKDFKNESGDSPYQVGELYSINYDVRAGLDPPHVEDVGVISRAYKRTLGRGEFRKELSNIASSNMNMHIRDLFGKCLIWEKRKGFLCQGKNVPNESVLVATLKHDLFASQYNDESKVEFYIQDGADYFVVKYVGDYDVSDVKRIGAGKFLRFSLARWWGGDGMFDPKRSYLQLSHIYD